MTQEKDVQEKTATSRERVFTPEPFSPQWSDDPSDLLEIPLDFPYSTEEWDAIFKALLDLLNAKEHWIWDRAIRKLIRALEMEESQISNYEDYKPKPTEERVESIFEAIATQAPNNPQIFEAFCSSFKFLGADPPYNHLVLNWLNQLAASEDRQSPTQDAILAAQIFFDAYASTWRESSASLLEMLDHADLNVRACAAYQIGKFCGEKWLLDQAKKRLQQFEPTDSTNVSELDEIRETMRQQQEVTAGIPPLDEIMNLIRDKEIARPGIAGAFWDVIPTKGINAKEWLLDVLQNSPSEEPYIPYFPCDLAFDAHERFSRDADAIRRLIDMGRVGLALAAATDESYKIDALKPLLIELGNNDEPVTVRVASWHLAYFYHHLHPHGASLGYVELLDQLPEIDLFLLFSREKEPESPYAVVIYAKEPNQKLSRAIAQKWVDQIFSESLRGSTRTDLPSNYSHWYQKGYIDYCTFEKDADPNFVDQVIIGYRSQSLWNPKDFL